MQNKENENAASAEDSEIVLDDSFHDDPSLAFFDCATLDTLFYNEMLKGDDVESEGELGRNGDGEEVSTNVAPGVSYSMNQSNFEAMDSHGSSTKPDEENHASGIGDKSDQERKDGQYAYGDPDPGDLTLSARIQVGGDRPSSLDVTPFASTSGTIDQAQIASLQEDYRKGLMAARILSQREGAESPLGGLCEKGSDVASDVPQSLSEVKADKAANEKSDLQPLLECNSADRQPIQHFVETSSNKVSNEAKANSTYRQLANVEEVDESNTANEAKTSLQKSKCLSEKSETSRLILQFSSLASQLGINLPSHVIASLSTATGKRDHASDGKQCTAVGGHSKIGRLLLADTTKSVLSDTIGGTVSDGQESNTQKLRLGADDAHPASCPSLERSDHAANAEMYPTKTAARLSLSDANQDAVLTYDSFLGNLNQVECENGNHPNRKRKRRRIDECEVKLNALKEENLLLKRHLDNVLKKNQNLDAERAEAEQKMRKMLAGQLKSPASQVSPSDKEELDRLVARFTELYSDYGKTRQQELKFHLHQLRKLATPTTFTKMSLWTLGQNEQFFSNPKRGSLGAILFRELEITQAQASKIVERRHQVRSLSINIKKALDLLEELRALCEGKQRIFHERMSKCQEVLSPVQVIKLLMWVDDNSQTLEYVCPGWGSERITSRKV